MWYCAIVGGPLLTFGWFVIHLIADTIAERRNARDIDIAEGIPVPPSTQARVIQFARDTVRTARRQHRRGPADEDPLKQVA